jgi:cytosine deaminase
MESVSVAAQRALTGNEVGVAPGRRADLVALRAATVREALAFAPADRVVIRAGRVISGHAPHPEMNC